AGSEGAGLFAGSRVRIGGSAQPARHADAQPHALFRLRRIHRASSSDSPVFARSEVPGTVRSAQLIQSSPEDTCSGAWEEGMGWCVNKNIHGRGVDRGTLFRPRTETIQLGGSSTG